MINGYPTRSRWRRWASRLTRFASSSTWDTKFLRTRASVPLRDSSSGDRRRNIGATRSALRLTLTPASAWAAVMGAITGRRLDSDAPHHVHFDLRQGGTAASRLARSDGLRRRGGD